MRVRKTKVRTRSWFVSLGVAALGTGLCVGGGLLAQESPPSPPPVPPSDRATLGPPVFSQPEEPPIMQVTLTVLQTKDDQKADDLLSILPLPKVEGLPTPPDTVKPPQPLPDHVELELGPHQEPPPPLGPEGVFSSPSVEGYRAGSATSGTKIDVPLLTFPGSLSVVTQDVIRDQQAQSIIDLVRNFGASTLSYDPRRESFNVRGFEIGPRDFRWNGYLDPFTPFRDLANVERIELLKGPASFLYGPGQPSGLVNWITKTPQAKFSTSFDVAADNYGMRRTTVDSTGPIDPDGRVLFRINAAYQNTNDGYRDFYFNERVFFDPSITWIINRDTYLNLEASYTNDRRRFDTGLIAIGSQIIPVPPSRFLNQPNDYERMDDYKIAATLYHQFNDCWTGKIGAFATWLNAPEAATVPFVNPLLPPAFIFGFNDSTIYRQRQDLDTRNEQYYSIIAELNGKFDTGTLKHNLLFGTELSFLKSRELGNASDPLQPVDFGPPFGFQPFPSATLDFANPNYTQAPAQLVSPFFSHLQQQRYGFYVQDFIDLTPKWKVLAGVREDLVFQQFGNSFSSLIGGNEVGFPFVAANTDYVRTTPRVGLVYEPIHDVLSFYGTYAWSFDPPVSGVYSNPAAIKPETGQIIEGGLKLDLFCKRLSLTAAGFYITKRNVAEPIPDSLNPFLLRQVGEQRSQGAEVGAVGKITDRWSILANYAYVDARTLADVDPATVGQRLPNAPYNNGSVWSRFNIIDNTCQTLGLGAGVVYVGNRTGDFQDTFSMPGYMRCDAGLFFRRGIFNANLYVENIFDRGYYAASNPTFGSQAVMPGAPITVRLLIGVSF